MVVLCLIALIMKEEQEMIGRKFNSFKELELTFGLSRLCEKHHINYFINDHKLENVKEHSYLGITIDQSMSFIPHINNH